MVVKEYQLGNAEIRVYRPKLTDETLKMRERGIRSALYLVGKSLAETREENTYGNANKTGGVR